MEFFKPLVATVRHFIISILFYQVGLPFDGNLCMNVHFQNLVVFDPVFCHENFSLFMLLFHKLTSYYIHKSHLSNKYFMFFSQIEVLRSSLNSV